MSTATAGSGSPEGRLANVAGAVLLGGSSSRLGTDKAQLRLGPLPLATRTASLLAGLCQEVLLVGGEPPADAPGRRVADRTGPACALRGLASALEAASAERVLVLATDLPLLTPDLLLALIAWPEADAVVPRTRDGLHPLCALYRREVVLAAALQALAGGRLALRDVLEEVELVTLDESDLAPVDPDGVALLNVNTPEDLARARALHGRRPAPGR